MEMFLEEAFVLLRKSFTTCHHSGVTDAANCKSGLVDGVSIIIQKSVVSMAMVVWG